MTKIETGKSYNLGDGHDGPVIARVVAQGFDRISGSWVRYNLPDGRQGDTPLNHARNYWVAA